MNAVKQFLSESELGGVKFLQGDILDLASLFRVCKEYEVENIIHMAYFKILHAKANPLWATRVNCEGTGNVFEAARILRLKRVVWASSIAVFGPPEMYRGESIPTDAPHYPDTFYGACKSFNEHQAAYYCDTYSLDIIGLRYAVGYGPNKVGSTSYPIIHELIEKPAVGEPGKVPYGESVINWLHVDDAAAAAVYALRAPRTKTRVFTIAGETHSVKEVAEYVRNSSRRLRSHSRKGVWSSRVILICSQLVRNLGTTIDCPSKTESARQLMPSDASVGYRLSKDRHINSCGERVYRDRRSSRRRSGHPD